MMNIKKIMVVGSSNTDMVVRTSDFPSPGETMMGADFMMNPGGKGANQAMAAKRLGGDVMFVGKIGDDVFGKRSTALMKKAGINLDYLFVDDQSPSGVALITVNAKGENTIVVAPGSNEKLSSKDFDKAVSEFDQIDLILVQLEIPLSTVKHIIETAHRHEKQVVLNPAPAMELSDSLLSKLYMITPNETEAKKLTGIPVTNEKSAREAAKVLKNKGVEIVIITMGAMGAFVLSDSYTGLVASPAVKVKDTTAAGDTFNGALTVGISEGKPIREAVDFACRAASLSTTLPGAQSSIPTRKEVTDSA